MSLPRRVAFALILALSACSSSTEQGGGTPTPTPTPTGIGPAGGTVSTADGRVSVVVPPGALSSNITITAAAAASPPASAALVPGTAFDLGPDGTTFQQPVTLTIRYDPALLPAGASESNLALHKAVGGAWQEVAGTALDTAANTARVTILGFSTYGVLRKPPPPPPVDSMSIGPAGGTLIAAAGIVTLVFPQGALSEATMIKVEATSQRPDSAGLLSATVYAITPAALTLLKPVLLSVSYAPGTLPAGAAESELALHGAATVWARDSATAVDTVLNIVTAAPRTLGTHGVLRRPGGAHAATVAYVVDSVPAGRANHFGELAPAVAYACGRGTDAGQPRVVMHTGRAVTGGTLSLGCAVALRRSTGVGGSIAGPLQITAPGGFAMEGMSVSGTTVITVGGFFLLRANAFGGLVTTNVVPPAAAAPGRYTAPAASAACPSGGANVGTNAFAGGFNLNLNADIAGDCAFAVEENSGPQFALGGTGSLGGSGTLNYRANPISGLTMETKLKGTAQVGVDAHATLDTYSGKLHMSDAPTFAFTNNVSAQTAVTLDGVGSATFKLESNNIQNGDFKFSVSDLKLDGLGGTFGTLATQLLPDGAVIPELNWNQNGGTFNGPFSLRAPLGPAGRASPCDLAVGGAVYNGSFTGDFECHAKLRLTNDVALKGDMALKIRSSIMEFEATTVDAQGAVGIEAFGVEARLAALLTDGRMTKGAGVTADAGVSLLIKVVDFDVGGSTGGFHVFQGAGAPAPGAAPGTAPSARAVAGDSVVFRNVRTPPGFTGNAIEVFDVEVPVLVDSANLYASGYGVLINGASQNVTVRRSRFHGKGIAIESTPGTILIDQDTVETTSGSGVVLTANGPTTVRRSRLLSTGPSASALTATNYTTPLLLEDDTVVVANAFGLVFNNSAATVRRGRLTLSGEGGFGIMANLGSNLTIEDASLSAPDLPAFAATLGGRATVRRDTVTGSLSLTPGTFLRLEGNVFQSAQVNDHIDGGLLNDPMASGNTGLDPETDIESRIDFDGNGCRDYPPYANEKIGGVCVEDGIPIPSGAPGDVPAVTRPALTIPRPPGRP